MDVIELTRQLAGWKTIWLNKKNQELSENEEAPDWTVYSETELLKLLREKI